VNHILRPSRTGNLASQPEYSAKLAQYKAQPPANNKYRLTPEELAAIWVYSLEVKIGPAMPPGVQFYGAINCWLQNPAYYIQKAPEWVKEINGLLDSGLKRLPTWDKTLWRGTKLGVMPKVGDVIRNLGYLSTSTDQTVSGQWAAKQAYDYKQSIDAALRKGEPAPPRQTHFVIYFTGNFLGRDITGLTAQGGESEVLMPPGECWKVTDVALAKTGLTQLPTGNLNPASFKKGWEWLKVYGNKLPEDSLYGLTLRPFSPCPNPKQVGNILSLDEEAESVKNLDELETLSTAGDNTVESVGAQLEELEELNQALEELQDL